MAPDDKIHPSFESVVRHLVMPVFATASIFTLMPSRVRLACEETARAAPDRFAKELRRCVWRKDDALDLNGSLSLMSIGALRLLC